MFRIIFIESNLRLTTTHEKRTGSTMEIAMAQDGVPDALVSLSLFSDAASLGRGS